MEYVLPLRWSLEVTRREATELTDYLLQLARTCDVTVVDGSDEAVFQRHHRLWAPSARHIRPEPWPGHNGKVAGVVTGVRTARHEAVILADDDVRYDRRTAEQVVEALATSDLVRPQNVFTALPWHARWDTGRSLLNRALGHDYPGTHGVRRSTFLAMGGYDGDVLFENLELARTVAGAGGRVSDLPAVYVGRRPPAAAHFRSQRVRQAYDDIAQPARLLAELSLLPAAVIAARRSPYSFVGGALGAVLLGELGRRRAGGADVYPRSAALWVLPWLAERSVCVWLAVAQRALGGVRYGERRFERAATPLRLLRRSVPKRAALEASTVVSPTSWREGRPR